MSTKTIAKQLVQGGCTIEQYESTQNQRIERLKLWKERGIEVLIKNETKLINKGERILEAMRELSNT